MKTGCYLSVVFVCTLLTACSPINSIQPFDAKQASILLSETETAKPAKQMIAITLPRGQQWKMIDVSRTGKGAPLLLLPQGESEAHWTERVQTQIKPYANYPRLNALELVREEIAKTKMHCPETKATILTQTSEAVSYQLNVIGCDEIANQFQVGKAFNGMDAVYFVRYASVVTESTQHARMSQAIQSARLVRNPAVR